MVARKLAGCFLLICINRDYLGSKLSRFERIISGVSRKEAGLMPRYLVVKRGRQPVFLLDLYMPVRTVSHKHSVRPFISGSDEYSETIGSRQAFLRIR